MWSYYGSKTTLVDLYPTPIYDTIIEPFAGAAKYSLLHWEKEVILVDKYKTIIDIWEYLQSCSPNDILKLPRNLKFGDKLDDINFDCQAQKDFYGFIIGCGAEKPRRSAIKRKTTERPNHINYNLKRVAENLYKIKHWQFRCYDYRLSDMLLLEGSKCTYFIDPPYQFGGNSYVHSNKKIDFTELGEWCKTRPGQVIVCENTKADWLPFIPIKLNRGSLFSTTEAIWTNYHTHYNNIQLQLI